ncbi:hypothetical protein J4441_03770 [Candidatus Micrarchaeota archaeon]|nr:hypothetical protein [Candidatus Micrarchaeota archaeon]
MSLELNSQNKDRIRISLLAAIVVIAVGVLQKILEPIIVKLFPWICTSNAGQITEVANCKLFDIWDTTGVAAVIAGLIAIIILYAVADGLKP